MANMTNEIKQLANILWDYQRLNEELAPAEVIIAMGCEDRRVAERAAQLLLDGYGKWLICTGKNGTRTKELLAKAGFSTEAEYFASIAEQRGVDRAHILLEDQSTNSGENISYTKSLLADKNIEHNKIIAVTAPYSERRQRETYATQWPDQAIIITSPQLTLETYPNQDFSIDYLINALVGRVQRMKVYAQTGYQASVVVPEGVWRACEKLIALGFTDQVVQ